MLPIIWQAIRNVKNPHFFSTELGYQGELLAEIRSLLPNVDLPNSVVVQQEYQKRLAAHDTNVRPDVIIHVPTARGGNRKRDNFVVFELNRKAGPKEVQEDFTNLDTAMEKLQYPLAVFLNIASGRTQAAHYRGAFKARLHCFAVSPTRQGGISIKHGYWQNDQLIQESEDVA